MKRHDLYWILLLAAAVCLCHLPVALGSYALAYDQNDDFLPWRYFIGEVLSKGEFPLWNPYQAQGYPIHGDPQACVWYPITWVLSLLGGGYTLSDLRIEYLGHLLIGASGMFVFCRGAGQRGAWAALAGLAYATSGVAVGNAQHQSWIIGMAWLPWVGIGTLHWLRRPNTARLWLLCGSMAMMITGAYPMMTILAAYGIIALALYKWRSLASVRAWGIAGLGLMGVVALSLGTLASTAWIFEAFGRNEAMPLEFCQSNPFTPLSFISFFYPFVTTLRPDVFGTDLSMMNGFIGSSLCLGMAWLLFTGTTRSQKAILLVSLLFLGVSLGPDLPLRGWSYYLLPGFNISRFPALFRLGALFGFIVLGAMGLERGFSGQHTRRMHILLALFWSLLAFFAFALAFAKGADLWPSWFVPGTAQRETTLWQHVAVEAWKYLLLASCAWILYRWPLRRGLGVLLLLEFVLATHLNAPYTEFTREATDADISSWMNRQPKQWPLPPEGPVWNNRDEGYAYICLWKNLSNYRKVPAWDGFSSSFFRPGTFLPDSMPNRFRSRLRCPEALWASGLASAEDWRSDHASTDSAFVWCPQTPQPPQGHSAGDRIVWQRFEPHLMELMVHKQTPGLLVLQQHLERGWKATVDGKNVPILPVDQVLMGMEIPAGPHRVVWQYRPMQLVWVGRIEVAAWLLWLVLGLLLLRRTPEPAPTNSSEA